MPDTSAEVQFERFCDLKDVRWRRVWPAQKAGHKRPDYAIWTEQAACVAEVKQIDLNENDVRQQAEMQERGSTAWQEKEPGRRVRGKMTEAAGQLRPFAKRGIGGILVLFDGNRSLHYLDSYNIMTGMYGLDVLEIERAHASSLIWCTRRWRSGGKAKITPTTNTSISALAVLHIGPDREPYLVVYHNEYAAVPLDVSCVDRFADHQFVRKTRRPIAVDVWTHAITGEALE